MLESVGITLVSSTPELVKLPPVGLFSDVESTGADVVRVRKPLVKLEGYGSVQVLLKVKLGRMMVGTEEISDVRVVDSDAEEVPVGLFSSVVIMEEDAGGV